MRYVVYDKKTGAIIRTYRKVIAESGQLVPAKEHEVLADLPGGLSKDDVDFIVLKELNFESGKVYRVDVKSRQVVTAQAKKL